ncbi:hypothetical protein MLD38_015524 [Melastoma candidum]|uniref:Uncharacterized protein n=1 Tax=Melastoma candidum TaxID=119954 RepID=A0ACB9RPV2_9MYRT|nr:hypothetical protein MLD38_015524 [Melastoma candidum]
MPDSSEIVEVLQKMLTESTGTFFLVFVGCGGTIATNSGGEYMLKAGPVVNALIWGATMMVLMYSLGHFSDGFFNPAITLTLSQVPLCKAVIYVGAQIFGSMSGSFFLYLTLDATSPEYLQNVEMMLTRPTGSIYAAFLLETFGTFVLALVISDVVRDRKEGRTTSGLAVGGVAFLNVIISGPISGASMNPARSLGPAIVFWKYTCLWIYLLGPIAGALGGCFLYHLLRSSKTSRVAPVPANLADAGIPIGDSYRILIINASQYS